MLLYATSKNSGPTWIGADPVRLLYLGTSIEKAIEYVGFFSKYEVSIVTAPNKFTGLYSAIPIDVIKWRFERFYSADGWWISIVSFELEEEEIIIA